MQRGTSHFGRVNHTRGEQILIDHRLGVEAVRAGALLDLVDDHRAFQTAVFNDLAQRLLERPADNLHAELLALVIAALLQRLEAPDEGDPAARDHAFLDRRAGRVERILDPSLLLLHLGLGGRSHVDHRDPADQLREPLLELLPVVVAGGLFNLSADLLHPRLDLLLRAGAVDDRGVILVHGHPLGATEISEGEGLELDAQVFRDHLAASEGRNVLQHRLATIAEAWSLHRAGIEDAADLVHHQGGQGFTLDLLGDDQHS